MQSLNLQGHMAATSQRGYLNLNKTKLEVQFLSCRGHIEVFGSHLVCPVAGHMAQCTSEHLQCHRKLYWQ